MANINEKIFKAKYAISDDETFEMMCDRVGFNKDQSMAMINKLMSAAGRHLRTRNSGLNLTLFNCYLLTHLNIGGKGIDSRESINEHEGRADLIASRGGGIGGDWSCLRPKDSNISLNNGGSSGVVSFIKRFAYGQDVISQGGSRRAANLASLQVFHPDVVEFINVKQNLDIMNNMNISVSISDQFMMAVKEDKEIDLKFPDFELDKEKYNREWNGNLFETDLQMKTYKKVKARDIYENLCYNAWKTGEPGVLFYDNINNVSNYRDVEKILSTNPCQIDSSPIIKQNGLSTFKELKVGDKIWSENGWTSVVNKWSNGVKKVYEYRTTSGYFLGTENHRIVQNGEKIEVDLAESIDVLAGGLKITNINQKDVIDGLVIGDGITKDSKVFLYIGENDKCYFDSKVKNFIGHCSDNYRKTIFYVDTTIVPEELPLTYKRVIPERFKKDPNKMAGFLRGLFSANGSVVANGRRITLKASSFNIIKDVQLMLSSLGIRSYFTTNKSKKVSFDNGDYVCRESYDINITTDRFIFKEKIGFIHDYKMNKIIESGVNNRHKTSDIVSKTYIGELEVFDITVDNKTHTYWSGGHNVSNCGEQILPANSSCNLLSINLLEHLKNDFGIYNIDYDKLSNTIMLGIDYLDTAIDEEKYTDEIIEKNQKYYRQIGLGIMGLADLFIMLGIRYGSEKSFEVAEEIFQFMLDKSYMYSALRSKKYGKAPIWKGNKMHDHYLNLCSKETQDLVNKYGLRNSAVLSIAPTGSIAMMLKVNGGIEPYFAFRYERDDVLGKRIIEEDITKKAPNKECLVTAQEVTIEQHIRMQAIAQRYVDCAISKTINLPSTATIEDVKNAYMLAWELGCKGITVYRDGCRAGVLNHIKDDVNKDVTDIRNIFEKYGDKVIPIGIKPPKSSYMKKKKVKTNNGKKFYFMTGYLEETFETPFELFITTNCREKNDVVESLINKMRDLLVSKGVDQNIVEALKDKAKKSSQNNIDRIARLISMALRHNLKIVDIVNILDEYTESISSLIYHIKKHLESLISDNTIVESEKCPECGNNIIYVGGCKQCSDTNCGWSKC